MFGAIYLTDRTSDTVLTQKIGISDDIAVLNRQNAYTYLIVGFQVMLVSTHKMAYEKETVMCV